MQRKRSYQSVAYTDEGKLLGVAIDKRLTFETHFSKLMCQLQPSIIGHTQSGPAKVSSFGGKLLVQLLWENITNYGENKLSPLCQQS